MVHERSVGNLLLVLLAVALLGLSLLLPWFSYEHSSGRRTPHEGFHDPSDDGVITQTWEAGPATSAGTQGPDEPARADEATQRIGWAVFAAIGLLLLVALSEVPGVDRVLRRRISLALSLLGFGAIATALALTWFVLPGSYGHGVDDPFTSYLDGSGYTMTTLDLGWVAAAFALAPVFGGFLLKFQAGAPDPTVVAELYAQGEL